MILLDVGRSTCALAQTPTEPNRRSKTVELLPAINRSPRDSIGKFTPKIIGFRTASTTKVQEPKAAETKTEDLPKSDEVEFLPVQPKKSVDLPPLPPAERVVPLPIVPAEKGIQGFLSEETTDELIPNPNKPPAYVPPPQNTTPRLPSENPTLEPWRMPIERMQTPNFANPNAMPVVPSSASEPAFIPGVAQPRDELTLHHLPATDNRATHVPASFNDFQPTPLPGDLADPVQEGQAYYGKTAVPTQRPWVELWRPFYAPGQFPQAIPFPSPVNPLTPSFLVYGDYRAGVGVHRNNGQHVRSLASRLNLDMDLRLTGTERFHLFTGPLDHNGRFTRLDFSNDKVEFVEELDAQIDTAFFEGDLGAITGSWLGDDAPFDLPFTCGLVPLLYQNGIWMEDAIAGFAVGAPWKHNRALNWSNYEATFFAGFNQVTSPAFNNDNNAAAVYGTAWFIEAYNGYIETDYAYLDDLDKQDRSYHNAAIAYTRRYFGRISNSVRLIGNIGQSGPVINRSADGALLLFENSLISAQPSTLVPYWNCFVGSGRPQSVARAANAGGILRNTGINFETDGLTGFPTLNATASNSYGGAIGLNVLSADFRKQLVFEFAALDTYGNPALSAAAGPEYAVGTRYQTALNNRLIWRVDLMNGWFDNAPDIYGTRTEIRWKF